MNRSAPDTLSNHVQTTAVSGVNDQKTSSNGSVCTSANFVKMENVNTQNSEDANSPAGYNVASRQNPDAGSPKSSADEPVATVHLRINVGSRSDAPSEISQTHSTRSTRKAVKANTPSKHTTRSNVAASTLSAPHVEMRLGLYDYRIYRGIKCNGNMYAPAMENLSEVYETPIEAAMAHDRELLRRDGTQTIKANLNFPSPTLRAAAARTLSVLAELRRHNKNCLPGWFVDHILKWEGETASMPASAVPHTIAIRPGSAADKKTVPKSGNDKHSTQNGNNRDASHASKETPKPKRSVSSDATKHQDTVPARPVRQSARNLRKRQISRTYSVASLEDELPSHGKSGKSAGSRGKSSTDKKRSRQSKRRDTSSRAAPVPIPYGRFQPAPTVKHEIPMGHVPGENASGTQLCMSLQNILLPNMKVTNFDPVTGEGEFELTDPTAPGSDNLPSNKDLPAARQPCTKSLNTDVLLHHEMMIGHNNILTFEDDMTRKSRSPRSNGNSNSTSSVADAASVASSSSDQDLKYSNFELIAEADTSFDEYFDYNSDGEDSVLCELPPSVHMLFDFMGGASPRDGGSLFQSCYPPSVSPNIRGSYKPIYAEIDLGSGSLPLLHVPGESRRRRSLQNKRHIADSKFRGVFPAGDHMWAAFFREQRLGIFRDEHAAARAVDKALIEYARQRRKKLDDVIKYCNFPTDCHLFADLEVASKRRRTEESSHESGSDTLIHILGHAPGSVVDYVSPADGLQFDDDVQFADFSFGLS